MGSYLEYVVILAKTNTLPNECVSYVNFSKVCFNIYFSLSITTCKQVQRFFFTAHMQSP